MGFGHLEFPQRRLQRLTNKRNIKLEGRQQRLPSELRCQEFAQFTGKCEWPQSFELNFVGAYVCLRHQPYQHKAFPVFVRFGPSVRPSVVAACAIFHEQCFAYLRFFTVDFAEHVFRPAWWRQAFQLVLDPLKLKYRGVRLEQPLGGRFGAQIDGHVNAHNLSKIATNGVLAKALHCVHNPCGAFHRKGGLVGAVPAVQFS